MNAKVEDPTLWDDAEAAQALMRERTRLAYQVERVRKLEQGVADALEFAELARALAAACIAFVAAYGLVHTLPPVSTHRGDFLVLAAGSAAWALAALTILTVSGSKLPSQILRRKSA